MNTITLKSDYQVRQLLQSIASNLLDFRERGTESKAKTMILKDLLNMAIDIEEQTSIKAYENTSIKSLFLDVYNTDINDFN